MKTYQPKTPSLRHKTTNDFSDITKVVPEKTLVEKLTRSYGRDVYGHLTSRHRGGGHKRVYRKIDFARNKLDVPAKVAGIEYDPNRSARIALLHYLDGEKRYIVAPDGLKVGSKVVSSDKEIDINMGNALLLKNIPTGTNIYNIELNPGDGGKMMRAAGSSALLVKKNDFNKVVILMPSKKEIILSGDCRASIGTIAGEGKIMKPFIKAGVKFYKMKARNKLWPRTSAVKMNAVDHPFGSGRGKRIKPKIAKRNAPAGNRVGHIRPRRTGRQK